MKFKKSLVGVVVAAGFATFLTGCTVVEKEPDTVVVPPSNTTIVDPPDKVIVTPPATSTTTTG